MVFRGTSSLKWSIAVIKSYTAYNNCNQFLLQLLLRHHTWHATCKQRIMGTEKLTPRKCQNTRITRILGDLNPGHYEWQETSMPTKTAAQKTSCDPITFVLLSGPEFLVLELLTWLLTVNNILWVSCFSSVDKVGNNLASSGNYYTH